MGRLETGGEKKLLDKLKAFSLHLISRNNIKRTATVNIHNPVTLVSLVLSQQYAPPLVPRGLWCLHCLLRLSTLTLSPRSWILFYFFLADGS